MTVKVLGNTRLAATLRAAADQLAHLDAATTQAGRAIQTRSRTLAPVRSGRLASSLAVQATGTESRVLSNVEYAGVIHYGWPAHNISANPFLVPTAKATEPVWRRFYVADVQRVLGHVKGI